MNNEWIRVENICKRYGGIYALENASLGFVKGEVHALLGENGAGKSTISKVLSGAIRPDSGKIIVDGNSFEGFDTRMSRAQGISMVYQELCLVPEMTVYENLFLGKELGNGIMLDKLSMIKKAKEIFEVLGVKINPRAKISSLSTGYCQLVEIGKAILDNVRLLILDEPTSSLTIQESEMMFKLIEKLTQNGITIIYISHRIEELLEISDRITVMRDGRVIETFDTETVSRQELICSMVGHELGTDYPPITDDGANGREVLKVNNICTKKLKDVSFSVHEGEILGLAGLVGAGRSEVVRAIFGADQIEQGEILINGSRVNIKSPKSAILHSISLIPEDRKNEGLHLSLPISFNISLVKLKQLSRAFIVNKKKELNLVNSYKDVLSIKLASVSKNVSSLSGGNQQKVVISKWLSTDSAIYFFDEPTRGIDIATKKEIYDLMDELRKKNKAIIMISSEMVELIGMCNRIIVMHEGRITKEIPHSKVSQELILEAASCQM